MKILLSAVAAAFSVLIYWAFLQKPLSESGAMLIADPWGIVTLVDLYIGFLLFGLFMFWTVPKKSALFIWVPALLILGNVVSLIYLIFYYKKLSNTVGVKNENQ